MCDKMYTLEVTERELARIMFVMGRTNGVDHIKPSTYVQAYNILMENKDHEKVENASEVLLGTIGVPVIRYAKVEEEWLRVLGIGEKSPVQQRIENLEKELDELKKLL